MTSNEIKEKRMIERKIKKRERKSEIRKRMKRGK